MTRDELLAEIAILTRTAENSGEKGIAGLLRAISNSANVNADRELWKLCRPFSSQCRLQHLASASESKKSAMRERWASTSEEVATARLHETMFTLSVKGRVLGITEES